MRLYPRVATPGQPNYFATGALSCTLRPRGCQLTLVHAPCHSPCTCCPQRRFPIGCNPPWAMLGRCSTLVDQCSMQFHCSLPGASAPRGPTYSTVQEQQTGFSTWFDDQHAFYVCMGDSLQKKSCRILLEHLKLNGHPIRSGFPPLKFRDHNGKKNFNSGILVCTIDTDSGPARFYPYSIITLPFVMHAIYSHNSHSYSYPYSYSYSIKSITLLILNYHAFIFIMHTIHPHGSIIIY